MKIFFARHGQYQNPDNVVPYRLPGFPLSAIGKQHALIQAEKLASEKIRAIYTSPIERCVQTATIIGQELHLFPNQKDEIMEARTPLQGIKAEDLPSDIYTTKEHIDGGGETREEIFTRMNDFVNTLKQTSQNSNYLLVSHADPIIIFLAHVLKQPVRVIPMGGLVLLDYSQKGIPKYSEII